MFQSFDDTSDPSLGPARLALVRKAMVSHGLGGYIVPRADEYQGEYVPACAERLKWLTGFSGSAGTCVVLPDKAAVFADGRYTTQARAQCHRDAFEIRQVPKEKMSDWLSANAPKGARIGYDPKLFTPNWLESFETALAPAGLVLTPVATNLVDAAWADRPAPPAGAVVLHTLQHAGVASEQKIKDLQATLTKAGEESLVITLPECIAWLFNIRGSDLRYTPFALSHAIVPASGRAQWFVDARKIGKEVREAVTSVADLLEPSALEQCLKQLGAKAAKVRIDPNTASKHIVDMLSGAGTKISKGADPCLLAKAKKNATELAGARAAHARDAVALCRLLALLDREGMGGKLDEIAVATALEGFRRDTGLLKDLSFDTISAAGPNAALPHYRVNTTTNRKLEPNSVFLIDSGGQYLDGTTDVTRTVAIGDPGREARTRNTLVLKGMISVTLARFPAGTRGQDLDPLARRALWSAGFDFDHGTGHGIGSYLSVHEGPHGISKAAAAVLEPGMIVSNEPGYYKEGQYGIRIENLVIVTEADPIAGGERPMHGFETLTLAPIDRAMIVTEMLTTEERAWLDAYHARVRTEVGPALDPADKAWLVRVTAPL